MDKAELRERVVTFLNFIKGADPSNVHNRVAVRVLEGGTDNNGLVWMDYTFTAEERHRNVYHILHGGVAATLFDDCIGILAAAAIGQDYVTTVSMSLNYLRTMRGEEFRLHTQLTHVGKQMVSGIGELYDADGRLCVTTIASYAVHEPPADGRL